MTSARWSNSERLLRIESKRKSFKIVPTYLVTPSEQRVQLKDKDLNTEPFVDNDDRRNKVRNRNNQPRRNIVVQQSQPQQQQYQDTKYI